MTSRAQMSLVRGGSHSENLTFSALLCEQMQSEKASDDETKNIAGQVLTYNSKNSHWLNKKLDLAWTMNGLGKPFRKSDPKNRKKSKNQSEIATCEQKTTSENANFCSNAVFSLYFKTRAKKIYAAKPLAFSLHFLCRRDQNHHFKNHENVWTDLKKNIAGRIPETTRRRKLPILMTKQLTKYCEPWTSINAIKIKEE